MRAQAIARSSLRTSLTRYSRSWGLWLLLLGHSFFALGGLAFAPMRFAGIVYQLGGVAALVPGVRSLTAFAIATAIGNLWIGLGVWRSDRG